jgi:hypothetical protein
MYLFGYIVELCCLIVDGAFNLALPVQMCFLNVSSLRIIRLNDQLFSLFLTVI